ncbi:MAG: polysaccharide biosynthesis tyrosine autokinase [Sphingobacteriaceae bacterium]|jgi:capsular exopolysaccharide synthesis family protein|nr:polysaccharide biosynthesis tyrosine autokinase [Sphingobacteriaceae bacterium]
MAANTPTNTDNLTQSIDYLKLLKIFWSRWYWIAACLLVAFTFTYIYLWYTPKVYSDTASLKFSEEKNEMSELLAVKSLSDRTNKVQAEAYVIQSKDVLLNAISRLDYKVSYFVKGRVRTTDIYPDKPFPVEIVNQDSTSFYQGLIEIKPINKSSIEIIAEGRKKAYRYNELISLRGLTFKVLSGPNAPESNYLIRFNRKEDFIGRVSSGLSMREAAKSSNVLLLTFTDRNIFFAKDILNSVIKEYIYYDNYRRTISASQTINFITEQLNFLSGQVKTSGLALENFKRQNKLFDIKTTASDKAEKVISREDQKNELQVQELEINDLEKRVRANKDNSDFNFQIEGKVDAMLSNLVSQLNQLFIDRNKQLLTYNENSAPVKLTDQQIANTKKAILENIENYRNRNRKLQVYFEHQISSAEQDMGELPSAERNYIKLQSDFEINQKVFSYLFEKKLEAQISKAAVVPGASVVDFADGYGAVISPVNKQAYLYALIAGLGLGIGIILLVRFTNPFIYDKETVEHLTNIPIIGIIRKFPGFIDKDNSQVLSLQKPKSIFAESVRSVRTNLSFLASEKKSKVICVTSEIAGEGKSFVSINIASTLALIDKRVILIAADLRKSKLHRTFHTDNKVGLSSYISRQDDLEKVILKTDNPLLDFLPSGPTPPNPSELLHSERMSTLISQLRETYDFVLIDTAPVGLVSDSIPLIRQADINLFVLRSGVSRYNAVNIPGRLAGEYNLNNVVMVLNAFTDDAFHSRYYSSSNSSSYQYYYSNYSGYSSEGYFEDEEKPKWWNLKNLFKNKKA